MNEINRVISHFVDLGFHLGRIEKSGGQGDFTSAA
jgi:hypothetical protein